MNTDTDTCRQRDTHTHTHTLNRFRVRGPTRLSTRYQLGTRLGSARPGPAPGIQSSVFSFLLRTVRFSHGLLALPLTDVASVGSVSVIGSPLWSPVSAVSALPASLPLLPLLPRLPLPQRCSTKKAGRIQRNFWFSSVLCLDVNRSVREKCSPASRDNKISSQSSNLTHHRPTHSHGECNSRNGMN